MNEVDFSNLIIKICIPALLIIGTFGNILSIVIFTKKSMKGYSTFQYLTLLSVIDLFVLYTGGCQIWLEHLFEINLRTMNNFFCKTHSFLVYFFTHFSSILLASMSIDRMIAILTGNSTKKIKARKTLKTFLIIALITALINFHFLIFMQLSSINQSQFNNESLAEKIHCYADPAVNASMYYFIYITNVFPWIDLTVYALLPFIVMIISSLIIIITTYKQSKKIKSNLKGQYGKHKQLIIALFVTDAVFISLVSPLVS